MIRKKDVEGFCFLCGKSDGKSDGYERILVRENPLSNKSYYAYNVHRSCFPTFVMRLSTSRDEVLSHDVEKIIDLVDRTED